MVVPLDHCDLLMMLEMRYCVDRAQWNETQPIVGVGLINVTGLQYGHRYSFRVVAMNGVPNSVRKTKTRSELHTITVRPPPVAPRLKGFFLQRAISVLNNN